MIEEVYSMANELYHRGLTRMKLREPIKLEKMKRTVYIDIMIRDATGIYAAVIVKPYQTKSYTISNFGSIIGAKYTVYCYIRNSLEEEHWYDVSHFKERLLHQPEDYCPPAGLANPDKGEFDAIGKIIHDHNTYEDAVYTNLANLLRIAIYKQQNVSLENEIEQFTKSSMISSEKANCLINILSEYDLSLIGPVSIRELMPGSYNYDFDLFYQFILLLINFTEDDRVFVPYCRDPMLPMLLAHKRPKIQLAINCIKKSLAALIKVLLSTKTETASQAENIDGPVMLQDTDDTSFDKIVLTPPLNDYITDQVIIDKYEVGQLVAGRKINTSLLMLEYCINKLSPGGYMAVILDHGFFSSSRLDRVRDFVLKKTKILAVISFPTGALNDRWGYQAGLLILQKRDSAASHKDEKTFIAVVENYCIDELNDIAAEYLTGSKGGGVGA